MTAAVLEVNGLCKSFGGVQAIKDLNFQVNSGEILGLIGPNGSGKSTTVNALAGVFPATSGDVLISGNSIISKSEYARVACGLARTFQTASIFAEFTVREQIKLGCNVTVKAHPLSSVLGIGRRLDEEREIESRVEDILELSSLSTVADQKVGTISSAQQRFLMIATALASQPKVLLLDEPAAGLISQERSDLMDMIQAIRSRGVSILVIEHHMALIMKICDRIVVLNFGSKIAEGTPDQIRNDKTVIDAYLGEAA